MIEMKKNEKNKNKKTPLFLTLCMLYLEFYKLQTQLYVKIVGDKLLS